MKWWSTTTSFVYTTCAHCGGATVLSLPYNHLFTQNSSFSFSFAFLSSSYLIFDPLILNYHFLSILSLKVFLFRRGKHSLRLMRVKIVVCENTRLLKIYVKLMYLSFFFFFGEWTIWAKRLLRVNRAFRYSWRFD